MEIDQTVKPNSGVEGATKRKHTPEQSNRRFSDLIEFGFKNVTGEITVHTRIGVPCLDGIGTCPVDYSSMSIHLDNIQAMDIEWLIASIRKEAERIS